MKTAKELFTELGWEQKISEQGNYYEIIEYGVDYDQGLCRGKGITFYCGEKVIEFDCQDRHFDMNVDIKLLSAINKQVEELGWNK